ncbi:MAG: response regulator [Acidobacteria bacterium]|nr:response regulator [Acidobacteriota bacterium]
MPSHRIAIVEDNRADVQLIEEALGERGIVHELRWYPDAERARSDLTGASAWTPDLVLLDLNLPGVGGLELMRCLRREPHLARIPFAVMSSSDLPEAVREARRAGASRFIVKPATLDEFFGAVGGAISELLAPEGDLGRAGEDQGLSRSPARSNSPA